MVVSFSRSNRFEAFTLARSDWAPLLFGSGTGQTKPFINAPQQVSQTDKARTNPVKIALDP
jgi:hypothetical protein